MRRSAPRMFRRDKLRRCEKDWIYFSFLLISVADWLNQRKQHLIEYLVEENRVLPPPHFERLADR